jgi:hypothetical protein
MSVSTDPWAADVHERQLTAGPEFDSPACQIELR